MAIAGFTRKFEWPRVVTVIGVCILFFVVQFFVLTTTRELPLSFSRKGVYGVFLANGQVYFGSLGHETERSVTLKNVFYLKLSKPVLTPDALDSQSDASLVKLGDELHGPEDHMEIMRQQILFIEKLRSDGKVAKAIEQYQQEKK